MKYIHEVVMITKIIYTFQGDRDSTSDTMDLCLTPPATGPVMQFIMSPSDHSGMLTVSASAASVSYLFVCCKDVIMLKC